jgi:SNF2 family DNA or RNA helicase
MKITFWKGVFVADHKTLDDEKILRKAGFASHEPTTCSPASCRGCRARIGRRYWTDRVESATRLRSYCLQKALDVMKHHLGKLAQSRAVDARINVPCPRGLAYKPYQRAGIAYAIQRKDTLFGDDMGLGKSIEALGFANYTHPKNILIVGPATLNLNWKIEAEKWLVDRYQCFIPKTSSDVVPPPDGRRLLVITNYEKITGIGPRAQRVPLSIIMLDSLTSSRLSLHDLDQLQLLSEVKKPPLLEAEPGRPGMWRALTETIAVEAARLLGWPRLSAVILPTGHDPDLKKACKTIKDTPLSRSLRRPWDLAIFDEAQALKNPESLRSRAVLGERGLFHSAKRNLFLSGTPLENYPKEIWPLAAAMAPAKFGDWWDFAKRYCGLHAEERAGKSIWVADGCTNHSELQQRLRTTFMIRRLKGDVLKELPPKRRQLILLDAQIDWSKYPEFQRWQELHDQAYENALAHLESAKSEAEYRSAAKKLETVTVPFTECSDLRHKTALLKLPHCLRYTDELIASGLDCLVIYAHHRDVLEQIHEHYGDQSCVIFGDTKISCRIPIVQEFQAGRKKIFIGGLKAAGTGITLTRASTVVFFETDWNPATMAQAEDRLCRIGQEKMVHVIHPVLDGSLDANMVRKMLRKKEAVYRVLDRPEQGNP